MLTPSRSTADKMPARRHNAFMTGMGVTTDGIRAWANALPEVTEKQHHLFQVPLWQVRGTTFLGMGRDETSAVFCIDEESANAAAAAGPEHATAVHRRDPRGSFLGLDVRLSRVSEERVAALVRQAWAEKAPKMLAKQQHTDD